MEIDLPQTEQVEVTDQERRQERDDPANPENNVQDEAAFLIGHVPKGGRNWQPLPVEEAKQKAAREHIGAAFDRGRDDLRPPSLESWPGHNAMRDREEGKEQRIGEHRDRE